MFHFTVEPLNGGHFGGASLVPCKEIVPILKRPLSEILQYAIGPYIGHSMP